MNVIVHYPKNSAEQKILDEKVSRIHAQAVIQKLQTISCSQEQKQRLLKEIIKTMLVK